jgi:hypothetical protein
MRYLDFNVKSMLPYTHSQPRISRKGFSMLKRSFLLGLTALLVAALSSCIFDPGKGDGTTTKPPEYHKVPLTNKSAVLNNIEFAYNKRDFPTYDELLDLNFTFFYTEGDVGGSGVPVQWGRDVETQTTSGLLDKDKGADKIDMKIDWKDADGHSKVVWNEQISGSETWYFTTVNYDFTIKIGDTTYIPNSGAKAQFTVRNDGTAENPKWKLVEFRDLGGPS